MAYLDFSLEEVVERFCLTAATARLFPRLTPLPVPPTLAAYLREGEPFAFQSDKARSEFITAPILLAVIAQGKEPLSLYSGEPFDVDTANGLSGACDFILSPTTMLPTVSASVLHVVMGKKVDLDNGYGQCAAQLVGALRFNQRQPNLKPFLYGCVSTGREWRFLRLEANRLTFDTHTFLLDDLATDAGNVLAAFDAVLRESLAP